MSNNTRITFKFEFPQVAPTNTTTELPEIAKSTAFRYCCSRCMSKRLTMDLLWEHMLSVHGTIVPVSCSSCAVKEVSMLEMILHAREHHSKEITSLRTQSKGLAQKVTPSQCYVSGALFHTIIPDHPEVPADEAVEIVL